MLENFHFFKLNVKTIKQDRLLNITDITSFRRNLHGLRLKDAG